MGKQKDVILDGEVKLEGTASINEVEKALSKLGITLTNTLEKAKSISTVFQGLKGLDLSQTQETAKILKNKSVIKHGKNYYTYSPRSESDNKRADELTDSIIKAQEKELELREKRIKLMEDELNKTIPIAQKNADSRAQNAVSNVSEAARKKRESDELANFRAYKNAHPEEFGSIRRSKAYQTGQLIGSATSAFADRGLIGRGVSDVGAVVQTGMIGGAWGAAASAVGILAKNINELTKACEESYANIESLKTQLSVVFGGYTQSSQMYSDIARYATKSPFGIEQTTELATLLRQSGVEATKVMDTLKMLGDTATGDMEKMKRIANNYAQIVSIGKASMLDMRQFAYAGIPIFEAISKELGVSQTKLRKMISDGKVTAEIVEKVFKDMTGINGIFEEATAKGAKTLKARKQNLEDIKTLAKAGIGESITRVGERYGGDSWRMTTLKIAEDFYQKLSDVTTFKNIEQSVKNISNAKADKTALQTEKNKLEAKSLKEGLTEVETYRYKQILGQLAEIDDVLADFDKIRSDAATFYEISKNWLEEHPFNKPMIDKAINQAAMSTLPMGYGGLQLNLGTVADVERLNMSQTAYNAVHNKNNRLAYDEKRILKAQEDTRGLVSESRKKSNSYENAAQELLTEYESTEKYKQKEEEERKKRLTSIYNELQEIAKNTRPGNIIDFSKTSYEELQSLISKGAISSTRDLSVVTDNKSKEELQKDLSTLLYQSGIRSDEAKRYLENNSELSKKIPELGYILQDYNKMLRGQDMGRAVRFGNTKKALKLYTTVWGDLEDQIENTIKDNPGWEQGEKFVKGFKTILQQALTEFVVTDTKGVTLSDLFVDTSKGQQIPLWKRILGSNLGISPSAVTGTESALDLYQGNLQARKRAGDVLGTALKGGYTTVSEIQQLLSPSLGKHKNWADTGETWQTDWEQVNKNIKNFSLAIRSSTDVIKSYKSNLEEERDTLVNLLTSSFTTYESEKTNSRFITASAIKNDKVFFSEDDIGVNAFGEELRTTTGEVVGSIKDGIAYDEKGVKLENQTLEISGKIYELLKERLKEKEGEVTEAKRIEAINTILQNEKNGAIGNRIINDMSINRGWDDYSLIMRNKEAASSLFEAHTQQYITDHNMYGGSMDKFMEDYAKGNYAAQEIAKYIMDEIFREMQESLSVNGGADYESMRKADALLQQRADLKTQVGNLLYGNSIYSQNKDAYIAGGGAGSVWNAINADRSNNILEENVLSSLGLNKGLDIGSLAESMGLDEESLRKQFSAAYLVGEMEKVRDSISDVTLEMGKMALISPFETLGKDTLALVNNTKTFDQYLSEVGDSARNMAGDLLKNLGTIMQTAGMSIVSSKAMEHDWAGVAAGLGLAALGGFASGFGSSLTETNKNEKNDEYERLQSITDQLKELLAQARADALYYEKNLRHKTALGISDKFSYTAVNDAIITKKGDIVKTSPEDYLIATKTPQNLGNTVVQPQINFSVVDNVGVQVRQEKKQNADGSIDIIAVIEGAVGEYIASSKSDDAFNARQYRLNGRSGIR